MMPEASKRKAFKNALRTAFAARARGVELTPAEDAALDRLMQFKTRDLYAAKLVAAWAAGVPPFTVLAAHERCCTETLRGRIDGYVDAMNGGG
jgi:hypothetical protein